MKNNREQAVSPFLNTIHRIGRIGSFAVILSFVGAGVAVCYHNHYFPSLTQVLTVSLPIFLAMLLSSLGEFLGFLPVLGPGATYISYITGNVSNMKLPSIMGAMEALDVDEDSEEYHILTTISAVVASLLVIALLTVVVLFSAQLKPFLEWDPIKPAFDNVLPALYPVLLIGLLRRNFVVCVLTGIAIIPAILYLNPVTSNAGGVFAAMLFASLFSLLLFKMKQRKKN